MQNHFLTIWDLHVSAFIYYYQICLKFWSTGGQVVGKVERLREKEKEFLDRDKSMVIGGGRDGGVEVEEGLEGINGDGKKEKRKIKVN